MTLATSKYPITLNSNGYVLIEESRRKRAQQPFNPRFSSGDNTLTDLSYWQFLGQEGFTSEGQDKFQDRLKFRQSSGWDLRGGKARIGHGIESLPLLASVPKPYVAVAAVTLDDMVTGTLNASLWNDGVSGNAGLITCSDGSYAARSGYIETSGYAILDSGTFGTPPTVSYTMTDSPFGSADKLYTGSDAITGALTEIPARGPSIDEVTKYTSDLGLKAYNVRNPSTNTDLGTHSYNTWTYKTQQICQLGMHGLTLQSVGDFSFSFQVRHNNTGIHAGVGFMLDSSSGGGYVLELSGAGGTTAKLFKTTKKNSWDNTGDTLLKTWTLGTSAYNNKTVIKISVAAGNVFSLYQDGTLNGGGTVTDTTYTTGDCFRFTTAYSASGDTSIGNITIPGPAGSASGMTGKFVHYNNKLYVGYNANSVADFTFTNLVDASQTSNLPGITHVKCRDLAVWHRDSDPTGALNSITNRSSYLCVVAGTDLKIYQGTTLAYTQSINAVPNATGACVIPVDSKTLLIVSVSAENSGLVIIDRLAFTANTWTLAAQKTIHLDGGVSGTVVNSYAFDSNGTLYIATVDQSGTQGSMPSRLIQITATDLLATNLCVSRVTTIPDFTVRSLTAIAGTVYLVGAFIEGNYAYSAVLKYPTTLVYKSTKALQLSGGNLANLFNFGIASIWGGATGFRFLSQTELDLWDPILDLDGNDFVKECAAFNSGQFVTNGPNVVAIAEWNGRFYCLNAYSGTLQRTLTTRGGLGTDFSYLTLELSKMGTNTNLINKTLYSVVLELSEVLPDGQSFDVLVNGTVIGTFSSSDGTRKEITVTSEVTATDFKIQLRFPQTCTWEGYINNGPLAKFIPTQLKKWAWSVGVRVTRGLRLIDGTTETRTPADQLADLEAAWTSNIPVPFVDVDGTSWTVIVTDIDEREPLIDPHGIQEHLVFLELLQV